MSFSITPDPANRKVLINLGNSSRDARRGIRQGFFALGRDLRQAVRDGIKKGPKTGRRYLIKSRKRLHRASAAGEDPANLTGSLRSSVGFQIKGSESMEFGYRNVIGKNGKVVDYGAFLEVGTKKMQPRPALIRQVLATRRNAEKHFEREIAKSLRNPRG